MQSFSLCLLLSACDEDLPEVRSGSSERGPAAEPGLVMSCVDPDACDVVWLELTPAPTEPVGFWVNGTFLGWTDGVELVVEPGTSDVVEVESGDVVVARALVSYGEDVAPGAHTVAMAVGGNCNSFTVQSVGGCVVAAGVDFRAIPSTGSIPPDVRFLLSTGGFVPGHATSAWWPTGSWPTGSARLDGLGYRFTAPLNVPVVVSAAHAPDPTRRYVGTALCTPQGPVVLAGP